MLKMWTVGRETFLHIGISGEAIAPIGHYTLSFYPDGACEIFSFRTYASQWKLGLKDEYNFYAEEELPVFYV